MNPIGTVWRGIVLDCQWQQQADPWSAYPARAGTSAGRDVLQYGRNGHQLLARSPVERESVPNRVAFGEPKSIRRNLPSAQVNGNARPGNWPGVFISLCWQRVTAFPPPTPALSISQVRFCEILGSESNHDGCSRCPKKRPRTLGLSREQVEPG